jgi:2-keto-4-pentenoate hydratase/2-oxohepta-3-ene-1,7-dioic acid hydratase in catechol pathway
MKFVSYVKDGITGSGVLEGDTIRPMTLSGGDAMLAYLRSGMARPELTDDWLSLKDVSLTAPLMSPPRIFGIGLNYQEHAAESKMVVQKVPTVFLKLSSSITGPDSEVLLPPNATEPDYEAELAVVIGKPGHRILAEDWEQHVFGYTIVNDVSARGVQLATSQWNLGKSFPTFTPMGPCIVTRDEVKNPHARHQSHAFGGGNAICKYARPAVSHSAIAGVHFEHCSA